MYCIRCGVELADTEKSCPLCQTPVYHPAVQQGQSQALYPSERMPAAPERSLWRQGVVTALWVLAALVTALCDQQLSGRITWSGFVLGGLAVSYVLLVLPLWFRRPNPVIFVPCAFAAAGLYLWYLCLATGGHWFWPFALPVTGAFAVTVTAAVTLLRYLRRGRLFILGGAGVLLSGCMLLLEALLQFTFAAVHFSGWSVYPAAVLLLMGLLLIFLGICRPAREWMHRKFFL